VPKKGFLKRCTLIRRSVADLLAGPAPVKTNRSGHESGGDRRQCRRYAVEGSAQLYLNGGQTHTCGRLTDISVSDCYVEMYVPYAVGTELQGQWKSAVSKLWQTASSEWSIPDLVSESSLGVSRTKTACG
jgi:hypothetical protein